ncbi:hypothetical protein Fot_02292 [Forsythia ovata]|uniref:Uncharacterized protein n=1 Tax=Forsythia ovata TaxID=205694 RepID=A0ABD1X9H9_9LAMI
MEVIQKLDLKSSEDQKEYNSEDEGYLSENSSSVYLSNNITEAPLLLEPPQNEGIMIEDETEYDYELSSSEADQVDSFGCCSCFSFINFFKGIHFRKYEVETEVVAEIPYQHVSVCMGRKARVTKKKKFSKTSNIDYDILEEDDFMNEFNRPVKQVEIPLPKGS